MTAPDPWRDPLGDPPEIGAPVWIATAWREVAGGLCVDGYWWRDALGIISPGSVVAWRPRGPGERAEDAPAWPEHRGRKP
jgi:hypothetical protein